jgi:DNA-binding MarR family transcriptional regulator
MYPTSSLLDGMDSSHAHLWAEFASLLRGLKELNGHVMGRAGVPCEASGAAVLVRLELLGPVRLTGLAQDLGLDPSSVSRQVSALERSGWVARGDDPDDRRAQQLRLTPEGLEAVHRLRAERAAVLARLTPDWSEADLAELISLLARLNHDITANRDLLGARLENA